MYHTVAEKDEFLFTNKKIQISKGIVRRPYVRFASPRKTVERT